MSVHAPPPSSSGSLEAIVQRAGGVRASDHGHGVVTRYESAAGELAACVSAVGLADCSHVRKLLVVGPPAPLRELTSRVTETELAPGGAVLAGGAWWCAESAGQRLVLCEPRAAARIQSTVSGAARGLNLRITDHSPDWAALAVVGARTRELLADLGVYGPSGDPRSVAPVRRHRCAGATATWLLQADDTAWAILPRCEAPALWRALERGGRSLSLCAVGWEAVVRYGLLRRSAGRR